MAKITTEEVARIARLARIAIANAEAAKMAKELTAILGYVEKLNSVDTKNTKITSQVTGLKSVWRKDEVKPSFERELAIRNAPQTKDGFIKVKKVL